MNFKEVKTNDISEPFGKCKLGRKKNMPMLFEPLYYNARQTDFIHDPMIDLTGEIEILLKKAENFDHLFLGMLSYWMVTPFDTNSNSAAPIARDSGKYR